MTIMPVSREPVDRDPLSAALRPPIDETEEEKAHRLADEEAAKRVSLAIDEAIKLEDKQRKKRRLVRLLLLGQSESGPFIHSYVSESRIRSCIQQGSLPHYAVSLQPLLPHES